MSDKVTVVDYGIGNLYSVTRALEHCGAEVVLTSDTEAISRADRLVLPGVGAFSDGMQGLRERGLVEALRTFAASGRPMLGICLGMQMLAGVSDEFGKHEGLNLIPGRVVAVPSTRADNMPHKIPNIGWRELDPTAGSSWTATPLASTQPGTSVYLVHSFHMLPDDPAHVLATCEYGDHPVTAAVGSGNVFGLQFHPEKSSSGGLSILTSFLNL